MSWPEIVPFESADGTRGFVALGLWSAEPEQVLAALRAVYGDDAARGRYAQMVRAARLTEEIKREYAASGLDRDAFVKKALARTWASNGGRKVSRARLYQATRESV